VANIFSNVLISLVDVMLERVKVGGKIALSGIIENQVEEVQNVFKERGIVFSEPKQMGQWFLLDGVKGLSCLIICLRCMKRWWGENYPVSLATAPFKV